MNNSDIFTHNLPQFGFYRINQDRKSVHLKLSDPPNDKKRHDKLLDITMLINAMVPRNVIEIMQISKNNKDTFKYACGIFIVMNIDPRDIINFVKSYQPVIPFERGLELIKKRFIKPSSSYAQDNDCEIFCTDIKIDLKCSFTQMKIKTPVKG